MLVLSLSKDEISGSWFDKLTTSRNLEARAHQHRTSDGSCSCCAEMPVQSVQRVVQAGVVRQRVEFGRDGIRLALVGDADHRSRTAVVLHDDVTAVRSNADRVGASANR